MSGKVELGFVEKAQCPEELTSCHFPSKVGGKPVWLNPVCLPTPEETACSVCGFPRTFLLQVYAPLEDTPAAFHRTFFVFVCLNSSCHQQNNSHGLRVFRSQLPRENPFYGADHEDDDEGGSSEDELIRTESGGVSEDSSTSDSITEPLSCTSTTNALVDSSALVSSLNCLSLSSKKSSEQGREPTPLCVVCGSAGPKKCSRCKAVHYCSKHHQTHDWKSGHKLFCSDLASGRCRPLDVTYNPSHTVCLPEFVLVTEEEPPVTAASEVGEERGEEERMKDYYKFVKSGSYHDHSTSSKTGKKRVQSVMERAESGTMSDKFFRAFQRRVAIEPEQVIRYQRGGQPLLVSRDGVPQATDIPPCSCGAKRQFEFQVMPQLLYYLKLDTVSEGSVDWGTIIIYSCQASCSPPGTGHTLEFAWKQNFTVTSKNV